MKYFHGNIQSACIQMLAMALIWNFHPYGQGEILQANDHYFLQAVSQNLVLDDRLLLESDYLIGQVPEIFYKEGLA
jgi:hypothetical protein